MADVDIAIPFDAYAGHEPYIFVSYAHKDSHLVYPELRRLHEGAYRVWYDEGIDPGNEWPDAIANALSSASFFLVYVTNASLQSRNVRNEVNFALNQNKPFLAIHLEQTDVPPGLQLRMGDIQAIMKWRMSEEHFIRKLSSSIPHSILATTPAACQPHDKRAKVLSKIAAAERIAKDSIANNEDILAQIGDSNPDVVTPLLSVRTSLNDTLYHLEETNRPFRDGGSPNLTELDNIDQHIEVTIKHVQTANQSLGHVRQALAMRSWSESCDK